MSAPKYTYRGRKITGTSTTGRIFPDSGITKATARQTYFNTKTGRVYECSVGGKPKVAKWVYVRTGISAKPDTAVARLTAPARQSGNRKMKATWSVPGTLTNEKNGKRAQGLNITWSLGIPGKDPKHFVKDTAESHTSSTVDLDRFTVGKKTYTRSSFYPLTSKKLSYVTVKVNPYNKKGAGSKPVKQTTEFFPPKAPTIGNFSFNTETGVVSVGITATEETGLRLRERYDTRYKVTVRGRDGKTRVTTDTSSTSTSVTASYNVSDYQQLTYSQYVRVTVEAWSRGYKGDSGHVSKSYVVAYPARATISTPQVSSRSSTGKCTIPLKTNSSATHPVDRVRLEYLANVEYSAASAIPGDASWESTEIVDDANCTALSIPVTNLVPDRGEYTWVRVKSFHANENVLYRYSNYQRVKGLETPAATAADERITILSATPGTDGKSVKVHLGWNKTGTDDATGTELTWSDASDAWKSTEDPDQYLFTWSEGSVTVSGTTYRSSATITIKNLEEGTKYYIRARRYLEGDPDTYSRYSNTATCFTSETPEAITATCERYIPKGKPLPVYWTLSGNGLQKKWQIVTSRGTVISRGNSSVGATRISASRLKAVSTNGSVSFTVQASTGSGFVVSETHTVTVIEPPTLQLNVAASLTVQPLAFTATTSTPCRLIVIVTSNGIGGQFPEGIKTQVAGDTIHSGIYTPVMTQNVQTGLWTGTVTLPTGLEFWDGGNYTVSVTAVDRTTKLQSSEQTGKFGVAWAHQAQDPTDYITLTPIDITDDESDSHHQAVQITLTPPSGSYVLSADTTIVTGKTYYELSEGVYTAVTPAGSENPTQQGWYEVNGDLYDIYRKTGDGAYLIGQGFPLSYTTTDEYAPFGEDLELHYRIALRTTDGDVAFGDVEYEAPARHMRFDWAGGSLELPYNLTIGDQYEKDVDIRKHMDGSMDGYWNQNIQRSASLKSDLIYLSQQDEIESARNLARYPGAVFVRLPDGSAYEADVQVSDLSSDGTLTKIAIDATEIGLTEEFVLPSPYTFEDEETEESQGG